MEIFVDVVDALAIVVGAHKVVAAGVALVRDMVRRWQQIVGEDY